MIETAIGGIGGRIARNICYLLGAVAAMRDVSKQVQFQRDPDQFSKICATVQHRMLLNRQACIDQTLPDTGAWRSILNVRTKHPPLRHDSNLEQVAAYPPGLCQTDPKRL